MLDYRALAALKTVIDTQSFETAAQALCITQSAVSQRIKTLENSLGEPLLIRTLPYRPTRLGEKILGHYQRVKLLEDSLTTELVQEKETPKISIALSRDSLETWFPAIMEKLDNLRLTIIADDQEKTVEYLKQGIVSACASTQPKTISGCKTTLLGYFDYVLVASPAFKKKYFADSKKLKNNLMEAPTLLFDRNDDLPNRYLKHFFNITHPILNYHLIPSVAGFRQFALQGYGYALIPKIDVLNDLKHNRLISLFPDKIWEMPVYWHTWEVETKAYQVFNQQVISMAKRLLRQPT